MIQLEKHGVLGIILNKGDLAMDVLSLERKSLSLEVEIFGNVCLPQKLSMLLLELSDLEVH